VALHGARLPEQQLRNARLQRARGRAAVARRGVGGLAVGQRARAQVRILGRQPRLASPQRLQLRRRDTRGRPLVVTRRPSTAGAAGRRAAT